MWKGYCQVPNEVPVKITCPVVTVLRKREIDLPGIEAGVCNENPRCPSALVTAQPLLGRVCGELSWRKFVEHPRCSGKGERRE
jgi:hypothetical protein